ncbi:MAG: hypothetical protein DRQ42_01600 [Gammaproteobacteria bacterium]|nr:MAG: hypothetical protein DRQ42_01600 [Gammaproteobacteria bacterium]
MSEIKTVPITMIGPNPHRYLNHYPWKENKVAALQHSIADIGLWESIIVRERGEGFEMAFGHHRLEAARREGLTDVNVIVKKLTDLQMLQYMGRENGEDYSSDYLIMLNSWEGAVRFLSRHDEKNSQSIEIAKVLGWTVTQKGKATDTMNDVAQACNAGHVLIEAGYISRDDLQGLSVRSAKDIVGQALSRMKQIDKAAKSTERPAAEVKQAKKHVAKAVKVTAKQVINGEVKSSQVRSRVDVNAFKSASTSKAKPTPLFSVFSKALSNSIDNMLKSDATAEKLAEVVKAVDSITLDEDVAVVKRLDFYLGEVSNRALGWQKKLIPSKDKVVSITSKRLEDKS